MLNHSDLEYLKHVNGIRKKLGFSLDINQLAKHSFLNTLVEATCIEPIPNQLNSESAIAW